MKIRKTVTRKVIEANRNNSLQSSGPTTARGKKAVRHNAVTHGLLARALVFKNEKEKHSVRTYSKRLCEDVAPLDALETMYVEDLANNEWRLKRATRWEQRIRMGNSTTEVVEDALQSSTNKLGILYLPEGTNRRVWRCKELTISLKNDPDSGNQSGSFSGDRRGVELSAKLTDPLAGCGKTRFTIRSA